MAGFSKLAAQFQAAGTGLAAISADSAAALAELAAARAIPFPLLSDADRRVIRAWGLYRRERGGIARPALFWIGADGVVRYAAEERMAARVPAGEMLELARAGANPSRALPRARWSWPGLGDW
ncbi:MAG: redoxin domain-containing protein, partial [Terriglobales bacterium]